MPLKPEERSRQQIDALLSAVGWVVQDYAQLNLGVSRGVAVREFPLSTGPTDYLLVVDRQAVGVVEAKKVGETLTGVEIQSAKYREGHPGALPVARSPLPFAYETTGVETRFTNGLELDPRSRPVFAFHRPETLEAWLAHAPAGAENRLMRSRLQRLPALPTLWPASASAPSSASTLPFLKSTTKLCSLSVSPLLAAQPKHDRGGIGGVKTDRQAPAIAVDSA